MSDTRILMSEKTVNTSVACAFIPEINKIKPEPKGIPIH